jgi:cysteine desulfurase / selenocysteine lyase
MKAIGRLTPGYFARTFAESRSTAARLIGADAAEIALTTNTSHALNVAAGLLVARRRAGHAGRVILVSRGEFPANVHPWLALEPLGFRVDFIDTGPEGFPDEDALEDRVGAGGAAALAISSIQFASGFRADLGRLGRACRSAGALFIVDGIQQAGAEPVAVRPAGVDMYAAGAQKWLCSPFGSGFFYVRREIVTELSPLFPGWLAFASSLDFDRLTEYRGDLLDDARRFEVGTLPLDAFAGFNAAAALLLDVGLDAIAAHIARLRARVTAAADAAGVPLLSPREAGRASGIISLGLDDAEAAAGRLLERGVTCVAREGRLRISPHLYNTDADIDCLLDALQIA